MSAQRILVTGGAGFIGSAVCAGLAGAGYRVRILDDLSTGRAESCAPEHELVVGDVADVDAVDAAVRGCAGVVHLAALVSVPASFAEPDACRRVNVDGTRHVRDACRRHDVARLVFASSCAIYGAGGEEPLREDGPEAPGSPYAESKLAGEALCSALGDAALALRFFNVYGPGQSAESGYAAAVPSFFRAALAGEPLAVHGDGRQTRDFVFIADVVRAVLLGVGGAGRGPLNVGSGKGTEIGALATTINELVGAGSAIVHTEERKGDVRACTADLTRVRQQLGWQPTHTPREGLAATLAWWRAQVEVD